MSFYDSLFNGRQDARLVDTGQPFQYSEEHLDECLGTLDQLTWSGRWS